MSVVAIDGFDLVLAMSCFWCNCLQLENCSGCKPLCRKLKIAQHCWSANPLSASAQKPKKRCSCGRLWRRSSALLPDERPKPVRPKNAKSGRPENAKLVNATQSKPWRDVRCVVFKCTTTTTTTCLLPNSRALH